MLAWICACFMVSQGFKINDQLLKVALRGPGPEAWQLPVSHADEEQLCQWSYGHL